jgi:hypothetical protein
MTHSTSRFEVGDFMRVGNAHNFVTLSSAEAATMDATADGPSTGVVALVDRRPVREVSELRPARSRPAIQSRSRLALAVPGLSSRAAKSDLISLALGLSSFVARL